VLDEDDETLDVVAPVSARVRELHTVHGNAGVRVSAHIVYVLNEPLAVGGGSGAGDTGASDNVAAWRDTAALRVGGNNVPRSAPSVPSEGVAFRRACPPATRAAHTRAADAKPLAAREAGVKRARPASVAEPVIAIVPWAGEADAAEKEAEAEAEAEAGQKLPRGRKSFRRASTAEAGAEE
jgi:hypothetical protein